MSAYDFMIEDFGDVDILDYFMDVVIPAYCGECGGIGDFEPDFRGPCPYCGCTDCASALELLI